ncbi:MAG: hypothetical protein JRI80_02975 [Deltaproteobacteria bacterium]|nr:hypothetical protein [Deltaproteobacteria bacterium]
MPKPLKYVLYASMVLIGLVAMYSLLNAGNPHSLLRTFLPDPNDDVYVAVASSVLVFILGFIVFFSRDREGFMELIELNQKKIRDLRKKGKSDGEIAESILAAMGSYGGYKHNLARKKLIYYLAQFR